jgi:hypothetical protein
VHTVDWDAPVSAKRGSVNDTSTLDSVHHHLILELLLGILDTNRKSQPGGQRLHVISKLDHG